MKLIMDRASIHETSHDKSSTILWSFSECCNAADAIATCVHENLEPILPAR